MIQLWYEHGMVVTSLSVNNLSLRPGCHSGFVNSLSVAQESPFLTTTVTGYPYYSPGLHAISFGDTLISLLLCMAGTLEPVEFDRMQLQWEREPTDKRPPPRAFLLELLCWRDFGDKEF